VLPSGITLSIICFIKYLLTTDAIDKKLLSTNLVCIALDKWASHDKVSTRLVIVYNLDQYLALCDVHLAIDGVHSLFISNFGW
jgi:hypothetical protein